MSFLNAIQLKCLKHFLFDSFSQDVFVVDILVDIIIKDLGKTLKFFQAQVFNGLGLIFTGDYDLSHDPVSFTEGNALLDQVIRHFRRIEEAL